MAMINKDEPMLDFSAAIDESFLHAQAAPSFVAVEVAVGDPQEDAVSNFVLQVTAHEKRLNEWMNRGQTHLQNMERDLAASGTTLDSGQVGRLIRLSEAMAHRAQHRASTYAKTVRGLNKLVRSSSKNSSVAGGFVQNLTNRVEAAFGTEIEFLTDMSDHHRGLARAYAEDKKTTGPFASADALIAHLKSA